MSKKYSYDWLLDFRWLIQEDVEEEYGYFQKHPRIFDDFLKRLNAFREKADEKFEEYECEPGLWEEALKSQFSIWCGFDFDSFKEEYELLMTEQYGFFSRRPAMYREFEELFKRIKESL